MGLGLVFFLWGCAGAAPRESGRRAQRPSTAEKNRAVPAAGGVAEPAGSAADRSSDREPTADFTREEVLAELRQLYPQVSLPPDAPLADVSERLNVYYARHDEVDLQLDLFVPAARGPWPGVVVVHGGGWERGERQMENPFARQLAARGFAVATISYRLGPAGRFPNAPHDVESAARWMRNAGRDLGIAALPVGLVGASAGGALVAWVGALPPAGGRDDPHPGAVVVIDGPVDFTAPALVAKENESPGAPTRFLGGPFGLRGEVWWDASALAHIGPHSAPTLFINSTASTPILPGRAEMRAWLGALGIDAQTVVIPDTPHTFWLVRPWFDQVVDLTAQFLKRHLTAASPAPATSSDGEGRARPAPATPPSTTRGTEPLRTNKKANRKAKHRAKKTRRSAMP